MRRVLAGTLLTAAMVAGLAAFGHPRVGSGATAAALCGGSNRWDVKTLSDLRGSTLPPLNPDANPPPVLKSDAEVRTIRYLVTQAHDKIGTKTPRLVGVEQRKYVLKDVTLVEAKVEEDQDLHLVIRDSETPQNRMIVEFPNGACNVNAPPTYKGLIKKARAAVDALLPECRTGAIRGWVQLHGTATMRGVGFFDLVHGSTQHGVAQNEVELHPALRFDGSC
jgi:hypothetical protein